MDRLHYIRAVLGLPFLQKLVISAFGLNELAVVRVFVLLYLASATRGLFSSYGSCRTAVGLRIQDVDDVAQAVAVLSQQVTKFGLKLNFFLQLGAAFQGFKFGQLCCELLLKLAEFCET